MPICIECCYPVSQLYHVLHSRNHKSPPAPPPPQPPSAQPTHEISASNLAGIIPSSQKATSGPNAPRETKRASSGAGGGDVRLTQCPRCKRFADKYVEHDFVVLFIDLVLVKPQVYRHLLFNRLSRDDDELDPSILRLGTLLLLFDVYLTWSHIESLPQPLTATSPIPRLPILLQYAFFLFLCAASTLSQHLTIRWLARSFNLGGTSSPEQQQQHNSPTPANGSVPLPAPPRKPTPNALSTALFVSSCMSLFPILMVVWTYDDNDNDSSSSSSSAAPALPPNIAFASGFLSTPGRRGVDWVRRGVSWAVAVQNLEAVRILLGCGYLGAGGLVAGGGVVRWMVRKAILSTVGLGQAG